MCMSSTEIMQICNDHTRFRTRRTQKHDTLCKQNKLKRLCKKLIRTIEVLLEFVDFGSVLGTTLKM